MFLFLSILVDIPREGRIGIYLVLLHLYFMRKKNFWKEKKNIEPHEIKIKNLNNVIEKKSEISINGKKKMIWVMFKMMKMMKIHLSDIENLNWKFPKKMSHRAIVTLSIIKLSYCRSFTHRFPIYISNTVNSQNNFWKSLISRLFTLSIKKSAHFELFKDPFLILTGNICRRNRSFTPAF